MTDNIVEFPAEVTSKLQEKQEPNLWRPPSLDKDKRPQFNYANMQSLISAIFYKVGKDKFGLRQHEFEITLDTELNGHYSILGGTKVLIVWNVIPKVEKYFDEIMIDCLSRVRALKHPVAIESLAKLKARQAEIPKYEEWNGVPSKDCNIELYRLVKVIHRPTGLVSIQYAKEEKGVTWTKLISQGRFEIKDGILAIRGHDEQTKTS